MVNLNPKLAGTRYPGYVFGAAPRNVYWETTIACDLACRHCRAEAMPERDPLELTTEEARELLREIKRMGSMLILTGGDPLKRADLFDLIEYGRNLGIPISITPSTTPTLTRSVVRELKALGVAAMGISLDGPTAGIHDNFRGVEGTFENSMQALSWAREFKIPVQINTTITSGTLPHIMSLYDLLATQATPPVRRWSLFLLVPVGRGAELGIPTSAEVDNLFAWVYDISTNAPFHIGTVEAPHYRRFWLQRKLSEGLSEGAARVFAMRMGFGVRDGNGVIFVSHRGHVYPSGFMAQPELGSILDQPLSRIYRRHSALLRLRDMEQLKGKCGSCDFKWMCGGSRARAYATTGDYLESDPFCSYQPEST
ncbi:MAG: TIGR04053 family radical SAM/SPASM domain-containing protein [Gemmatimonadales bacterium]